MPMVNPGAYAHRLLSDLREELQGALIVIAPDGTVLAGNGGVEHVFGYTADEMVGCSFFDTIVPPDEAEDERRWIAAAQQAGTVTYEAIRRRKDGIRIWVDVCARSVVDPDGGGTMIIKSARDITGIWYQREARALQTRFRGALDAAPDAIVLVDRDGRITFVNAETERLFGYARHELLGQLVEMLVPLGARAAHPAHRERYFSDPRTRPMGSGLELSGRRKDGSEFPVEISLSPLALDGATLAMAAIRDVTARKRTEAKFRGLLEAAPDAMVIVDQQGQISLINSQTEQLFGYARDELLGQPVEILVPAMLRQRHTAYRSKYLGDPHRRPMGVGLALSGRRKDGTEFPVEISLSPVETEDGMLVTAAVRDISERLRLEEIRREVAASRAAEAALTRHASELARSNAELEQFAYVASHDMQEPLRMVANYAQLLAKRYRGRLDADADEFIGYVVGGAARMHQLITDLLTYSRVGTQGKPFGPVDCEALLARVLADLRLAVEQSGAVITHDPLPTVPGDASQLGQLLQNLLANAIKFCGSGPPRVHIHAEPEPSGWTFSVSDNGIGIAPEYGDRIFLIFQRLHTTAEYPGTGIGLAIAKKIVERHGGRIWIESGREAGATFCFTLPARPPHRTPAELGDPIGEPRGVA
jgi:PAS domain S-box-containing protein